MQIDTPDTARQFPKCRNQAIALIGNGGPWVNECYGGFSPTSPKSLMQTALSRFVSSLRDCVLDGGGLTANHSNLIQRGPLSILTKPLGLSPAETPNRELQEHTIYGETAQPTPA